MWTLVTATLQKTWKPQVGYSTNVHRSRRLADIYRYLREFTLPIKQRVYGESSAGLELHLNIGTTKDLMEPRAREKFRAFLVEAGLVLFSVNAYPLLDFHARRVKETVYLPSWAERKRARWTSAIARVVADLIPDGLHGSISTLGGCFRPHSHGPATFRKLAANYLEALSAFLAVERERGKQLVLAVEPEPETSFETCAEVVAFFEDYLLPLACERWKRKGSRSRIEADLRRVFTVNLDTCHLSVLFEDQEANLRTLAAGGLKLGKVHVTNAVELRRPFRSRAAYQDLREMDEPRYFHQFCGSDSEGRVIWRGIDLSDLPRRLDPLLHPRVTAIRSHFHVPLYLRRYRRLYTTQDDTARALHAVRRAGECEHLVLETYTWPLLTRDGNRSEKLIEGIAKEFRWFLGLLGASASGQRFLA
jgi:hypothetical protein